MKVYLLDSDILIDFFKRRTDTVSLIEKLAKSSDICISVLSITELRSGWTSEESTLYLSKLYEIAQIISISPQIAELAGNYRQVYKRKGITLSTIDSLIAASAVHHAFCLVTRNKKDYPMPEVELYSR